MGASGRETQGYTTMQYANRQPDRYSDRQTERRGKHEDIPICIEKESERERGIDRHRQTEKEVQKE